MIGVCREVSEVEAFVSKTGNELKKRQLALVDESIQHVLIVNIWNADAVEFIEYGNPVFLIKGGRISNYGGYISINIDGISQMKRNPDIPRAHILRKWFENGGGQDVRNTIFGKEKGKYTTEKFYSLQNW